MSHKIHKNANARQQAYRDRKKAALIEARKAAYAAARDHGKHQQPDPVCLICVHNQNTVTQDRIAVTVMERA